MECACVVCMDDSPTPGFFFFLGGGVFLFFSFFFSHWPTKHSDTFSLSIGSNSLSKSSFIPSERSLLNEQSLTLGPHLSFP